MTRPLRQLAALFLVPPPPPTSVRVEARDSGSQRVIFAHGHASHVLGAASAGAVLELHGLPGVHVALCIDRPTPAATTRIRVWASRDHGATWTVDRSFDVSALGRETRLSRDG